MKKIAMVTGASRGIGAATALLLAEHGYAVCINYCNAKEQADTLVATIERRGGTAIAVKADIAIESEVLHLFDEVDHALGPVTALVNNAGTNGGMCEVENITAECLQTVFATNVFGTFIAGREAMKRMKQQGRGGSIVNVSSAITQFGGNRLAHYAASKAAINTFTIGFAREAAPYQIRVNAVSPGIINTDIHSAASQDHIAQLQKTLPMGRMGTPAEVAEMIVWLLSDKASYVSGAIFPVTGSR
jgi:NAD(P)-dependent dehydrogenase (short-subunit alcohol dehydrogenase family)